MRKYRYDMSECEECGKPMHPADASQYETCYECRGKGGKKIRTINSGNAEQVGRHTRSSKLLGGLPY